jgi:serine/threonine protein phosphatase PrpC
MGENYFGITDIGKHRQNNEDTFIANTILNNRFIAACVIDGVGGYEGGEVAADIAKHALLDHFKNPIPDTITMLRQALLSANQNILIEKQKVTGNNKMACVLTVVLVENKANKFYYAHVGDTRLYLFRDNSLVKITMDHSFVGLLEDSGRLDEEAAMTHPKRNEINKALGFEAPIVNATEYFETGESPFLPGDLLLLCSDGLTDMIDKSAITAILSLNKSLEEKGKALIDAANNTGGKDNITVVLVQNNLTSANHLATKRGRTKNPQKVNETETENNSIDFSSEKSKPKNQGLIFFLALVALLSTAAFLWQYFKKDKTNNIANSANVIPGSNKVYDQSFQDTINNSPGTVLLLTDSLFGSNIFIQDTVFINKDSIHITGGINSIITADTLAKKAVPLVISPSVKYLLFENLHIRNTDIIINAQNLDVLSFKDVQFTNAHLVIINQFKNGSFSGSIKDMGVADKDSSENLNQ